jgi:hypothetical protein
MCAEFGNACVLTEQKLRFYNEPTILWLAPTCDVPSGGHLEAVRRRNESRQGQGDRGKRKLGKATATSSGGMHRFRDVVRRRFRRHGSRTGAGSRVRDRLQCRSSPRRDCSESLTPGPGPIKFYDATTAGAARFTHAARADTGFDDCERSITPRRSFLATVTRCSLDQSALCDNLNGTCRRAPEAQLEIIPRPKLQTYDPEGPRSTVDLTIRLHNTKPRAAPVFRHVRSS